MTEQEFTPDRRPEPLVWLGRRYRALRHWFARGRARSRFWVPRVGDRVRLHGRGTWLVYGVSIRKRVVQLGKPGVVALEHVSPCTRDDLARHYNMDLDHKNRPIYRPGLTVPRFENVDEDGEPEVEAKLFLLPPAPDPAPDDEHRQDPSA